MWTKLRELLSKKLPIIEMLRFTNMNYGPAPDLQYAYI